MLCRKWIWIIYLIYGRLSNIMYMAVSFSLAQI